MPIYEYECIDNGHRFEVIQKFSDPPVTHCTVCGAAVQKLLSPPAIQFKGSGWYVTDYARKGQNTSESSQSKSASGKGESGSSSSTDPKKSSAADSGKSSS